MGCQANAMELSATLLVLLHLSTHVVNEGYALNPSCTCVRFTSTYGKERGTFSSPDYPRPYPARIDCLLYTFLASPHEIIELIFTDFDIYKEHNDCIRGDYLKVYWEVQGPGPPGSVDERSAWAHELCGARAETPPPLYSPGSALVLEFHTGASQNNATGFIGTYSFIDKRLFETDGVRVAGTECDFQFSRSGSRPTHGRLYSPRYPSIYPNNVRCSYHFHARPKERIKVVFEEVSLQKGDISCLRRADIIKVFDGRDTTAPTIAMLCNELTGYEVLSTGPALLLQFTANSATPGQGFAATFHFQPPPDSTVADSDRLLKLSFGKAFESLGPEVSATTMDRLLRTPISVTNERPSRGRKKPTDEYRSRSRSRSRCSRGRQSRVSKSPSPVITLNTKQKQRRPHSPSPLRALTRHENFTQHAPGLMRRSRSPTRANSRRKRSPTRDSIRRSRSPSRVPFRMSASRQPNISPTTHRERSQRQQHSAARNQPVSPRERSRPKHEQETSSQHHTPDYTPSSCHQEFSSDGTKHGTLTSPHFPLPYPPNTHCHYEFFGRGKERVRLIFQDFFLYKATDSSLDCTNVDSLQAFVNVDGRLEKIETFCGVDIPKPIMSNGPKLMLEFRGTHSSRYARGFKITYSFVENFGISTGRQLKEFPCAFVFNSTESHNGTFASPNSPGPYPRDTECTYFFHGGDNEKVHLHFISFDIEGVLPCEAVSASDYVEFSNYMTEDNRYGRYCGQMKEFHVESERNFFKVTFRSNDRLDGTGFKAIYQFLDVTDEYQSPMMDGTSRLYKVELLFLLTITTITQLQRILYH